MSEHDWVKAHGDISTCSRCGVVTQTDGSYDNFDCPGLDVPASCNLCHCCGERKHEFVEADVMRLEAELARLSAEVQDLAGAIVVIAVQCGITPGDVPLTGPQVLLLAQNVFDDVALLRARDEAAVSMQRYLWSLNTPHAEGLASQFEEAGKEKP